jgi:C-terminal processing protease CtpA/Prc
VDPTLNNQGPAKYRARLQDALAASFSAASPEDVDAQLAQLLASLGDPFTRALPPRQAAAFAAEEEGKVGGRVTYYLIRV